MKESIPIRPKEECITRTKHISVYKDIKGLHIFYCLFIPNSISSTFSFLQTVKNNRDERFQAVNKVVLVYKVLPEMWMVLPISTVDLALYNNNIKQLTFTSMERLQTFKNISKTQSSIQNTILLTNDDDTQKKNKYRLKYKFLL